ncbi:MAG TPA: methylated-DNA--[protein]-cysteine S-methyltransferase [Allosphingosinicella sp.]|uniref:methylated-DNA--[protein]-cysteine S-methyltransferase n=1 Tax=Allosphingosinicella sp. TaxID=2823234 RepID=UPI002EDA5654
MPNLLRTFPVGNLEFGRLSSPIGEVLVSWDGDGALRSLDFGDYEERMFRLMRRMYGGVDVHEAHVPNTLREVVCSYFSGNYEAFQNLPLAAYGSPFQHLVWNTLSHIPAGATISYREVARRIARPAACRAVGLANGANPIAIAIPCHRVIGSNRSLTGYGGGISRKAWLLRHERAAYVDKIP